MHLPLRDDWSLLARYLRTQRAKVCLLALLLLGSIGLQLINPQLVRSFIDAAQAGSPLATLLRLALLFLGAAFLNYLLTLALTYRYPNGGRGIDNIAFTLPRGSFTDITGQIGAGKTTLCGYCWGCCLRLAMKCAGMGRCDDLSSALDVETEQRLWERLTERQATCLVVSHRQAAWQRADQVIVLKEGRIDGMRPLTVLLATNAEMRRLWEQEEVRQ